MRLFRITTQREQPAAFDGVGASLYPGRWNVRARRAVYTTSRIPLGILEVMVQMSAATLSGFVAYPLEVPDDALTALDRAHFSPAWRSPAGRDECRALGEAWRASQASLGLVVPSAVVPEAYDFGDLNVVLDPLHPDFARVTIGPPLALDLDPRLQPRATVERPASTRRRRG